MRFVTIDDMPKCRCQWIINVDAAFATRGGAMTISPRLIIWTGTLMAAMIAWLGCVSANFSLTSGSLPLTAAFVVGAVIFLIRDPASFKIGQSWLQLLECVLLFMLISCLGAILSYLTMLHSSGFTDALLDRVDRALGFNWLAIYRRVSQHPRLHLILAQAYLACFWLPLVVWALLYRAHDVERMYRFLAAYGIALGLTVAIFYFFPARAAYAFYLGDVSLPANATSYGAAISGLRNGTLRTIDVTDLQGIITFPSFHAVMAIMFAWAAWPAPRLRIPMVIVNGLMFVAAVPIGGHYVVDLFGGTLVSLASIALAHRISQPSRTAHSAMKIGMDVSPAAGR